MFNIIILLNEVYYGINMDVDEIHRLLEHICKVVDRELLISHEARLRISPEIMSVVGAYVEKKYKDNNVELISETDCRTSLPKPSEYYLVVRRK